jgi:hypothetical protein
MSWSGPFREIFDKTSDLVLAAALFGLQAAFATGYLPAWVA